MKERLFIGIGSEIWTRHLPPVINKFQGAVNRRALKEGSSRHFKTLHGLHIALRVSGEIKSYSDNAADRPRKMRNKPYLTIEWVLLNEDWENKSDEELKGLLSEGIRAKYASLVAFARSRGELVNENQSLSYFNSLADNALSDI